VGSFSTSENGTFLTTPGEFVRLTKMLPGDVPPPPPRRHAAVCRIDAHRILAKSSGRGDDGTFSLNAQAVGTA
jgi:hypothetical protein